MSEKLGYSLVLQHILAFVISNAMHIKKIPIQYEYSIEQCSFICGQLCEMSPQKESEFYVFNTLQDNLTLATPKFILELILMTLIFLLLDKPLRLGIIIMRRQLANYISALNIEKLYCNYTLFTWKKPKTQRLMRFLKD